MSCEANYQLVLNVLAGMSKVELVFYKAFRETLVEYFQKTSLNGFGLLYYIRRRKYQRILWFMFIFMGCSFATYVVGFTLIYFLQNPTITSFDPTSYSIQNIPFPAVSICSTNKISRKAVEYYARHMLRQTNRGSIESFLKDLKLFAGFFDSSSVNLDAAMRFQRKLDSLTDGHFNVSAVLRQLSPRCEQLLIRCSWQGRLRDCAKLFEMHATVLGYCCIFNYQRGTTNHSDFSVEYPTDTNPLNGIILLLNTSKTDNFITDRSTSGYTVQIFAPNTFPDGSTGKVKELFVSPNEDVDIQIKVTSQTTTKDVRAHSPQKRHCYFADELSKKYGSAYTQAECLTRCKIRSIRALCGCLPFYTPIDMINSNSTFNHCTLADVDCLERYIVTWNTYRPKAQNIPDKLEQELQDSIICSDCLPLCAYNNYRFRKMTTRLSGMQYLYRNRNILQNTKSNESISMIKLYFSSPYSAHYSKKVIYNWYQILSNIGGVIGICMGCSFISGFEIIYFLGIRFFENLYNFRKA